MLEIEKHIFLSFADLSAMLKEKGRKILFFSSLFATIFLLFELTKEPLFTAKGSYEVHARENPPSLSSLLLFAPSESSSSSLGFQITSPLVLQKCIEQLGLEATLIEKTFPFPRRIWRNFLSWKGHRLYRKWAPVCPLFTVSPSHLFQELRYRGERFSRILTFSFQDERSFTVTSEGKNLGLGRLGEPFFFDGGEFTLLYKPKERFSVRLSPLPLVLQHLQKQIKVTQTREGAIHILHVQYKHPDPLFASLFVKTLFAACEEHLEEKRQKSIDCQLRYLEKRKEEVLQQFYSSLTQAKEGNILQGNILPRLQTKYQQEKIQLLFEMERIFSHLFPPLPSLEDMIAFMERVQLSGEEEENLTLENIQQMISFYGKKIEELQLKKRECDFALGQLSEREKMSTFFPLAQKFALSLEPLLEIQQKLAYESAWSQKEKEVLQESLGYEMQNLQKQIAEIKEGLVREEEGVKERLHLLEKRYLALLFARYQMVEKQLGPARDIWESEEKLKLHKKLQLKNFSHLVNLIETKNISHNISKLDANISLLPHASSLPLAPRLYMMPFLGALLGATLTFFFFLVQEVRLGPRASPENCKSLGIKSFDLRLRDNVQRVLYALEEKKRPFFASSAPHPMAEEILPLSCIGEKAKAEYLAKKADLVLYLVQEKRWRDLPNLPVDTLYLFPSQKKIPLRGLSPILQRFFSSFWSSSSAQHNFSKPQSS